MLGGTKVGEGSVDRLRTPAGPGQSTPPQKLLGFEYLGSFSVNNIEAFCFLFFLGGGGGERPLRPSLDPPLP